MDRDPAPGAAPALSSPPQRKKRRVLRYLGIALFGLLALAVAAPHVLNLGFVRRQVAEGMSAAMHTRVELGDLGFTWFSGLSLGDLTIQNPAGFDQAHPFLALRSLRGDLSMLQLIRGRLDLSGTVEGLVVHVDQDEHGHSNAEAIAATGKHVASSSGGTVSIKTHEGPDLGNLRLDRRLANALVEVRRGTELLESLQQLEGSVAKEFGSQSFRIELKAALHRPSQPDRPGSVALHADVDAQAETAHGQLAANGLDLSRWRPLLAALLGPGSLTTLEGIVDGTVQADAKGRTGEEELFLEGSLDVEAPRIAGAVVNGMDVRAQRWHVSPNLRMAPGKAGAPAVIDAGLFAADLGFATMHGLTAAELQPLLGNAQGLGFGFTVDLDAVAAFGGPLPESLRQNGGSLQGTLALPVAGGRMPELASLPQLVRAEAALKAKRLAANGFEFTEASASLSVKDDALAVRTGPGTLLDAGPVTGTLDVDLKDTKHLPFRLAATWKDGKAGDSAAWLLRYGAPVLAGLEAGSNLACIADLDLKLSGPALRNQGETWLQFFEAWSGDGNLALRDAAFTPAPALRALADAVAGNAGRVTMERFAGAFTMAKGTVQSQLLKLDAKGREYGFQGKTRLDGALDWTIDLTAMLQQHKDGAKVAAALGGKPIQAGLGGTLDAPQLRMPELGSLLQGALQNQGTDAIQKALQDLFGKHKR